MRRSNRFVLSLFSAVIAANSLQAQTRASVLDQRAIEVATASYLMTHYRPVFVNSGVDSSWALDPRVYVFPRQQVNRASLQRANDSIMRGNSPSVQRTSEMVVGRDAAHLQRVASLFGVGTVLSDDAVCKVTVSDLCRLGSRRGLVWLTAASIDRIGDATRGAISVYLLSRHISRNTDGSQIEKVASVSWACELEKKGEGATASWEVVMCGQISI
jgi:hypothetical protein